MSNDYNDKPATIPKAESQTKKIDTGIFNPELRDKLNAKNTYTSTENKLVMFFPNESEPLVITLNGSIILGRFRPEDNGQSNIDLSKYQGAVLGVSRFHAEISASGGRFQVKDLGSTNGTRINNVKIAPYHLVQFRSGDTLRLGHLSIMIG